MFRRTQLTLILLGFCGALGPAPGRAQHGDGATNPDGPRRPPLAQVTARSQVEIRVRSGAGTSGDKLRRMVAAVTAEAGPIRECYADISREHPSVQGELELSVQAPDEGNRPRLRGIRDTVDHPPLLDCVQDALRNMSLDNVDRPSQVIVTLIFDNSTSASRNFQEQAGQVEVRQEGESLVAEGGTVDGNVRFKAILPAGEEERARALHRMARRSIAGLLDCRRRAARRDMNSAGTMTLRITVPARGATRTRVLTSSVEDDRAGSCVGRVLRHVPAPAAARGNSKLEVQFSGVDVPSTDAPPPEVPAAAPATASR